MNDLEEYTTKLRIIRADGEYFSRALRDEYAIIVSEIAKISSLKNAASKISYEIVEKNYGYSKYLHIFLVDANRDHNCLFISCDVGLGTADAVFSYRAFGHRDERGEVYDSGETVSRLELIKLVVASLVREGN